MPPRAAIDGGLTVLKFIFWSLLAVNAGLYAYGQGYLGHFSGSEREPARLQNQLNGDKLAIISASKAEAAVAALKAPASEPDAETAKNPAEEPAKKTPEKAAEKKEEKIACVEFGNFLLADARRFEEKVAPLALGDHQARINLPGTEVSSYIVFIPPQGNKEGAEKKASELRALGVTNYFIMSDSQTMRWAISLGVFKSEAGAQTLLASLQKQGVHSARIAPRMSASKLLAFQFRNIPADTKSRLDKIRAGFPDKESRSCK
nr:SPOR domain-containing protein [Pseudoduganella rivuli]